MESGGFGRASEVTEKVVQFSKIATLEFRVYIKLFRMKRKILINDNLKKKEKRNWLTIVLVWKTKRIEWRKIYDLIHIYYKNYDFI